MSSLTSAALRHDARVTWQCVLQDCMYLHELGEESASFTKEEMQQGKHQDYEQRLYETFMNQLNSSTTAAATTASPTNTTISTTTNTTASTTTTSSAHSSKDHSNNTDKPQTSKTR